MDLIHFEVPQTRKLSKKEKRLLRNQQNHIQQIKKQNNLDLSIVNPLTDTQKKVFADFEMNYNLVLHGCAGTGKTFLLTYLSMDELINYETPYKKLYIVRSAVPTKDLGFMPGKLQDKLQVYEAPYRGIFSDLFKRGDAYEIAKQKGMVEFISTSYLRGITLNNCIIMVDEMQNLTFDELSTIMTRVGKNCKILFSGDYRQSDLIKDREKEGVKNFLKIINIMKSFKFIEFNSDDIVRSGVAKEFIIAREKLKL